ncbi:hypothetical protein ACHAO9_012639 [Fusarium lateritium]
MASSTHSPRSGSDVGLPSMANGPENSIVGIAHCSDQATITAHQDENTDTSQSIEPSYDRPEYGAKEKMDPSDQRPIPPGSPGEDSSIASSEHSQPDGLDFIEIQEIDDSGRDCELHVYEKRFDTRGEEVTLRVGVKQHFEPLKDKSHAAALVLIRSYDTSKELISTRLEIRSPHLRKALQKVIKSYPGVLFDTPDKIILDDDEVWCIFYYRVELDTYASSSNDPQLREHMTLCLQYMGRKFQSEISRFNATAENRKSTAGLDFKSLWMVFKPGSLFYQKVDNMDTVVVLHDALLMDKDEENEHWSLNVKRVKCNGTHMGYVYSYVDVGKYDGIVPFTSLRIFPIVFHQERERIENFLVERGRKYLSLTGIRHCQYRGIAKLNRLAEPTTRSYLLARTAVQQRIMVDFEEFYETALQPVFDDSEDELGAVADDLKFTDKQFLVCDHEIPGYTLINKQWGFFSVQNVEPVELTQDAFHKLVLPVEKKEILSSLISSRDVEGFTTDDFIEGKGRGLIVLLHGPPGVGKTFTAGTFKHVA